LHPKSVTIDPRIPADILGAVKRAEGALERVLADSADRVAVVWEVGGLTQSGDPTVRLSLTEEGVTRTGEFSEWDLEEGLQLRRRMRQVWDNVLKERIKIQLQRVRDSLSNEGA
jgi:hypothetical protein